LKEVKLAKNEPDKRESVFALGLLRLAKAESIR